MATLVCDLDGYTDLPPGHIANVVTYFEMREARDAVHFDLPSGVAIRRVVDIDVATYRALYRRIGQPWLWFSRLVMPDAVLARRLADPDTEVHFLEHGKEPVGLCEIRRKGGDIEVAMFGIVAEESGTGAAKGFLSAIVARCWAAGAERVWLHTCTFDHPAAVHFYRRLGFRPFKFAIEISRDPRLDGFLPEEAGSHVALIKP